MLFTYLEIDTNKNITKCIIRVQATGKQEKFTYELKWHMPITDCMVVENSEQRDTASINLVALRSRASNVRDQIKRQCSRDDKVL